MTEPQHYYDSGVYHDTYPGEAIGCCDKPPSDPIHTERPPDRVCGCERLSFRHFWGNECPDDPTPPKAATP